MEFEQLEAFLSIARTKSFTRSAEQLHIAQSTVTARIKLLEESIGRSLFSRDSRRVELSSAGRDFLPYAQRILELAHEGKQFLKLQGHFDEHLVIGSVQSLWDHALFSVIREFRREHPQFSMRLITGHSDDVIQRMMDGLVDVGIVYIPPHHPDIEVLPLASHSIHLMAHPSFAVEKMPLTPEDLHQLPFLHLNWGSPFTEWFEHFFGKHHIPAFQADNTSTFIRFLLSGDGIGFLLDFIARDYVETGQLKEIQLQSELEIPRRATYLIYPKRKKDSTGVKAWVEKIMEWDGQSDQ